MEIPQELKTKFKEEMKTSLIPSVQNLIDKEEKHLASLKGRREDSLTAKWWHSILPRDPKTIELLDQFIKECEGHLAHFKTRLQEYIEFTEKE